MSSARIETAIGMFTSPQKPLRISIPSAAAAADPIAELLEHSLKQSLVENCFGEMEQYLQEKITVC